MIRSLEVMNVDLNDSLTLLNRETVRKTHLWGDSFISRRGGGEISIRMFQGLYASYCSFSHIPGSRLLLICTSFSPVTSPYPLLTLIYPRCVRIHWWRHSIPAPVFVSLLKCFNFNWTEVKMMKKKNLFNEENRHLTEDLIYDVLHFHPYCHLLF